MTSIQVQLHYSHKGAMKNQSKAYPFRILFQAKVRVACERVSASRVVWYICIIIVHTLARLVKPTNSFGENQLSVAASIVAKIKL